jgi:2-polyprenyl-3-methyl-5-hydroxy-6-metoxy-1,4-benzoquinol methylase
MTTDRGIRVEDVTTCLLCQAEGTLLYQGLHDRLFGAPGTWGFSRCRRCGLVWLNPRPVPEDLPKGYMNYYTHDAGARRSRLGSLREKMELAVYSAASGYGGLADGRGWKLLGRVLSLLPPLREIGTMGTLCLNGARKGKLLDVGCGNGRFLALMRDAGWQVLGVEPDPAAACIAQTHFGVPVIVGTLPEARLSGESFDAVTVQHVIEHVYDPGELLEDCRRVLKPGGKLAVVTPNVESYGHRIFKEAWRGLEPPRHLRVFSPRTLKAYVEKFGFRQVLLRTSARLTRAIYRASRLNRANAGVSYETIGWKLWIEGLLFQAFEEMACLLWKNAGEEILLVAARP